MFKAIFKTSKIRNIMLAKKVRKREVNERLVYFYPISETICLFITERKGN